MTPLIWTLVFLAGFAFVQAIGFALAGARLRQRGRTRERLRRLSAQVSSQDAASELSILLEGSGERRGPLARATQRLGLLEPMELLVYRAGRPLELRTLVVLTLLSALAGGLLAGSLEPRGPLALAGLLGGLPIWIWLWRRKRKRMQLFESQLPEALDLLSRSMRAGHALTAGLQMVGEELDEPVGPEFALVGEEVRMGLDLPLALGNLAHRIDVPDMPFFVTALLIQRETGGNLAEIVDNLGRVIRERHATHGKIRSLTAQTRWSANILALAPFGFLALMSWANPSYLEPLFETPTGHGMLALATAMVGVGFAACRRAGGVQV